MKTPREGHVGGENADCYEVLADVDAAMRDGMSPDHHYYVLGGIASGALAHKGTVLDAASRLVVPATGSAIPTVRANGTRRDIDILVGAVLSEDDAERIKGNVKQAVGNQLVVSVFGFDRHESKLSWRQRQTARLGAWVSSRTIDASGTLRYELFPLAREVEPETYEPWKLQLPAGGTVEMLHPVGHTLAYDMRSISGPRAKDAAKRAAMRAHVLPQFPGITDFGELFHDWQQFGRDIELMRDRKVSVTGTRPDYRSLDVTAFRAKSHLLHGLESHESLVNIGQHDAVQRALNIFVHAK
jgi:hypothetical protein